MGSFFRLPLPHNGTRWVRLCNHAVGCGSLVGFHIERVSHLKSTG
jgi:hypothetical protein